MPEASKPWGEGAHTEIQETVTDFIVSNYLFGDASRAPAADDALVEVGIVDSTGVLELIQFLESHFGIEVAEAETVPENLGTVANITKFIMTKQSIHDSAAGESTGISA